MVVRYDRGAGKWCGGEHCVLTSSRVESLGLSVWSSFWILWLPSTMLKNVWLI